MRVIGTEQKDYLRQGITIRQKKTLQGRSDRMLRKEKPELVEKQKGVKIRGTQDERSEDILRRN